MRSHKTIALFALVAGIAMPADVKAQRDRLDDAAVYAAVTSTLLDSARIEAVLIRSVTKPRTGSIIPPAWEIAGQMAEVDSAMAGDLKRSSVTSRSIPPFSVRGKAVRMISDSVINSLKESPLGPEGGSDDGWADFRKRFPDASGILSFGGIGYSTDGQTAVVDVAYSSGGTGWGRIVILHQIEGKWSVARQRVYFRA